MHVRTYVREQTMYQSVCLQSMHPPMRVSGGHQAVSIIQDTAYLCMQSVKHQSTNGTCTCFLYFLSCTVQLHASSLFVCCISYVHIQYHAYMYNTHTASYSTCTVNPVNVHKHALHWWSIHTYVRRVHHTLCCIVCSMLMGTYVCVCVCSVTTIAVCLSVRLLSLQSSKSCA